MARPRPDNLVELLATIGEAGLCSYCEKREAEYFIVPSGWLICWRCYTRRHSLHRAPLEGCGWCAILQKAKLNDDGE